MAFAEVIESGLHSWRAQCWDQETIPAYGSVVTIDCGSRKLFGLVHDSTIGSHDTHRMVFTYQKTQEELQRDHPHIFEFLQTTFRCITLGYQEEGILYYQLPAEPPKIHSFVSQATDEELKQFFAHTQYCHTLFLHAQTIFSLDDLLLALLKELSQKGILTQDNLSQFIETFSLLTANDYRRLKLFLQRVEPFIQV